MSPDFQLAEYVVAFLEPWWREVDKTAREPEPDTRKVTPLPQTMPWTIAWA
jgi:hypothetical protein